jgi:hypothetical protein
MNEMREALARLGSPRLLVVGDLMLDRYTHGLAERSGGARTGGGLRGTGMRDGQDGRHIHHTNPDVGVQDILPCPHLSRLASTSQLVSPLMLERKADMASPLSPAQIQALPLTSVTLKTGDLFFCAGSSAGSKIIEDFTRSPWSHCGVVWVTAEIGRVLFLEAVERYGVRLSPASKYLTPVNGKLYDGPVVFARSSVVTPAGATAMLQFGCDQLTDPYSTREVIRIGARIALGIGRARPEDGWICSELAAACLRAAGPVVASQHGYVTPADLWADPTVSLLGRAA